MKKIPYLLFQMLPCSTERVHALQDELVAVSQRSSKCNIFANDLAFYTNLIQTKYQHTFHSFQLQQNRQSNTNID